MTRHAIKHQLWVQLRRLTAAKGQVRGSMAGFVGSSKRRRGPRPHETKLLLFLHFRPLQLHLCIQTTSRRRLSSGASTRSAHTRRVRQPSSREGGAEERRREEASITVRTSSHTLAVPVRDERDEVTHSTKRPLLHGVHMNKNCHFCEHSPKRSAIFTCTTQTCGQMFCEKCLTQHLKIPAGVTNQSFTNQSGASATWKCPLCLRQCCCLQQLCSKKHLHCKRHRRQLKQNSRKGTRG